MKTYFISGHRNLKKEDFDKYYVPKIQKALEEGASFVVGDCAGVDSMAQEYLQPFPSRVTVYHMFSKPRNLYGPEFNTVGGFTSDIERDRRMTEDSDSDIALIQKGHWTSGTAQNILRRYEI